MNEDLTDSAPLTRADIPELVRAVAATMKTADPKTQSKAVPQADSGEGTQPGEWPCKASIHGVHYPPPPLGAGGGGGGAKIKIKIKKHGASVPPQHGSDRALAHLGGITWGAQFWLVQAHFWGAQPSNYSAQGLRS